MSISDKARQMLAASFHDVTHMLTNNGLTFLEATSCIATECQNFDNVFITSLQSMQDVGAIEVSDFNYLYELDLNTALDEDDLCHLVDTTTMITEMSNLIIDSSDDSDWMMNEQETIDQVGAFLADLDEINALATSNVNTFIDIEGDLVTHYTKFVNMPVTESVKDELVDTTVSFFDNSYLDKITKSGQEVLCQLLSKSELTETFGYDSDSLSSTWEKKINLNEAYGRFAPTITIDSLPGFVTNVEHRADRESAPMIFKANKSRFAGRALPDMPCNEILLGSECATSDGKPRIEEGYEDGWEEACEYDLQQYKTPYGFGWTDAPHDGDAMHPPVIGLETGTYGIDGMYPHVIAAVDGTNVTVMAPWYVPAGLLRAQVAIQPEPSIEIVRHRSGIPVSNKMTISSKS